MEMDAEEKQREAIDGEKKIWRPGLPRGSRATTLCYSCNRFEVCRRLRETHRPVSCTLENYVPGA